MKQLTRARRIIEGYRGDPYVWARTKQVAGGLLVADGLIGLENPLDGKKSRPGIFGAGIGVVVGAVFLVLGWTFVSDMNFEGDATTTGVVVDTPDRGDTCGMVAEYIVDGQTYTASTSASSSSYCNNIGQDVTIEYISESPSKSQIKSNTDLWVWMFPGMGALVLVGSFGTLLVRLVSIIGGAVLFFQGRKAAKEHGAPNGNAEAAVAQAKEALVAALSAGRSSVARWSGSTSSRSASLATALSEFARARSVDPDHASEREAADATVPTAPVTGPDRQTGSVPFAATGSASYPAGHVAPPVTPSAPSTPPAGWYPTADGQWQRYWDGVVWTEHVQPLVAVYPENE